MKRIPITPRSAALNIANLRSRCASNQALRPAGASNAISRPRADAFQESRVQARLAGQLGMEADNEHLPLLGGHRVAVDLGEDRDVVAGLGDPRRPDEHGAHGATLHAGELEVGLERADLAAEGVAA